MKYYPYNEIINLKQEEKEYSKICTGKNKKYRYYSDWEEHIIKCLKNFPSQKDLYNFKHFCINKSRTLKYSPNLFSDFIIIFLSFFFAEIFKEYDLPFVFSALFVLVIICFAVIYNKKIIKESYIYSDIIEIIENRLN